MQHEACHCFIHKVQGSVSEAAHITWQSAVMGAERLSSQNHHQRATSCTTLCRPAD